MKNPINLLATLVLFFFSTQTIHAQSQADTAKVKPKYEYAIMTFRGIRIEKIENTFYNIQMDIDYENGKNEIFFKLNGLKNVFPDLFTYHSQLFKAFDYLATMRYELVTSRGNWDTGNGVQYIFRRERK